MADIDPELRPLSKVVSLAQEAAARPVALEVQRRGRERLLANVAMQGHLGSRRRRVHMGLGILTAMCVLSITAWSLRPRSLSYEVRGGSVLQSPYVGARADMPAEITFSDGSQLQADPGRRLRIAETQSSGARVFVERGVANAHIVHRQRSNWLFEAGPFEVRVTGTRLTIAWDPAKQELDLTLQEGSVEVRSPIGRNPVTVRAGQRFLAKVEASKQWTGQVMSSASPPGPSAKSVVSVEISERAKSEESPSARPEARPTNDSPAANANVARSKVPTPHRDSWQSLVMRGEFEAVIAAAGAKGIEGCLESCPASELRALADAARYTNRVELAEKSLLTLRQRFAGSGPSAGAAFLLGRTNESRGRNAKAEHWYELYLAESPEGEFASDALAGCMRVVATLRGKPAARSLALEYLRRYPDGVYASSARRIAGGPN